MFVADTHPLVHYAGGKNSRLGRKASRLFKEADEGRTIIHVPTVVLWEIAELTSRGLIQLPTRFDRWCGDLDAQPGFVVEPLFASDVDEARHLPFSDPFDCLIAGTALRLQYPLITKDRLIAASNLVATVW